MFKITFNAFSFLQAKLRKKRIPFSDSVMAVADGTRASDLIRQVRLEPDEVEAVFINGRVCASDTLLKEGDRVALIPPGTPGPYRVLLGFIKSKRK